VRLALDAVLPGGRVRILEVGHEDAGAGIERVDDHLSGDRPGDLDTAVLQVARRRGEAPARILANGARLFEEGRQPAGVELGLTLAASFEQLHAAWVELAVEAGDKRERLVREDPLVSLPEQLDSLHCASILRASSGWVGSRNPNSRLRSGSAARTVITSR